MKLSDYVIDFIVEQQVSHIFEFIGGAITHLLDSASGRSDIECVSVHHEQSGAFAAEAYARINGRLGVAMATSGPGALNMLTGIGSCYFDSVPCLFITGQVNTYEYKFDSPVRQIGFQETDIVSVARPLTKYAHLVVDAATIRYQLEKAVYLAGTGRPGPVLLDLPMNIQRAEVDAASLPSFFDSEEFRILSREPCCESAVVDRVAEMISQAERPVILAGGGVRCSGAADELERLITATGIPVVSSLMGLDAVSGDTAAYCGLIGSYGNRYGNLTLANCDLLLVLGSRLDTRQTGTRPDTFARAASKIQVDIDQHELNAKINADVAIHADLKTFLHELNGRVLKQSRRDLSSWHGVIDGFKSRYLTRLCEGDRDALDPNEIVEALAGRCAEGDIICLDVGQNQMWAAQSFRLKKGQRLLTSGGMGAMGFALPAALGAAKAAPGRGIVAITGDGGLQVNIQELETIVRHALPIKIIVLNNGCLGMVRQFQDMYFEGRQQSTVIGYGAPDLVKIACAYGVPAFAADTMQGVAKALDQALALTGPALMEVKLDRQSCVNPKLVVNRPIEDMSPFLEREELAEAMLIDMADEVDVPQ